MAAVLLAVAGAMVFSGPASALPRGMPVMASSCTAAIAAVERERDLPRGLLMAIGFGEAGRETADGVTIWPWTVNVEGQGHYFATRPEAVAFVRDQLAAGRKSIDVGCLQVNLRWHPQAFDNLDEAFRPEMNVAYGAQFLRALRDREPDDPEAWWRAVGNYHSATPERAAAYRARVRRSFDRLAQPMVLAALEGAPTGDVALLDRTRLGPGRAGSPTDPFGMELVAYWATPDALVIGPRDVNAPVIDMSVRPPFPGMGGPPMLEPAHPRRTAEAARPVKRFSRPLPPPPQPSIDPVRRKGLLASASGR